MTNKRIFKFLLVLFFFIAAVFLMEKNAHEIKNMIEAFTTGKVRWIIAALIAEAGALWFFILMHRQSFLTTGATTNLKRVSTLVLSASAVNAMAPTADTAAYVLYANDAIKNNEPATKIVAGVTLSTVIDYTAFSVILLFAGIYLQKLGELTTYMIISSTIFIAITLALLLLMYLGLTNGKVLGKIVHHISKIINTVAKKLKKKFRIAKDIETLINEEIKEISESLITNKLSALKAASFSILFHSSNILMLMFIFWAFNSPIKISVIVAGYAIGFLFKIVSPVPQGIGIVEGALTLVFTSLGISLATAVTVSLVYRMITFWIPFGISFLVLQKYNLSFPGDQTSLKKP